MLRGMMLAGVLTAGLLSTGLAFSDDAKPAKGDAKAAKGLPAHFRQLGLNDEQIQKIAAIHSEFKAKIDELTKQRDEMIEKQKEEIAKLLSEQQKEHLKQILAASALGKGGAPKIVSPTIRSVTDTDDKKEDKKEEKKDEKKDKK